MPYYNVPVASDPESSWQVRSKGKTFKALMGPSVPYHGDHVELSDNGDDYASTVGIGGVIDTKFTWPDDPSVLDPSTCLDGEKASELKKWMSIYHQKMLPKGTYLGELYSFGFDLPETHAIQAGGSVFYAFYAENWDGEIELRGLGDGYYRLVDYVNHIPLDKVKGPKDKFHASFSRFLLIEAIPESND
jgi:alpha-galactosidase